MKKFLFGLFMLVSTFAFIANASDAPADDADTNETKTEKCGEGK